MDVEVLLAPPEEMIWSKSFVLERERYDGADVNHLLHACGESLDWERLLHRFDRYWEVLFSHLLLFQFAYPVHPVDRAGLGDPRSCCGRTVETPPGGRSPGGAVPRATSCPASSTSTTSTGWGWATAAAGTSASVGREGARAMAEAPAARTFRLAAAADLHCRAGPARAVPRDREGGERRGRGAGHRRRPHRPRAGGRGEDAGRGAHRPAGALRGGAREPRLRGRRGEGDRPRPRRGEGRASWTATTPSSTSGSGSPA